MKKILILLLLSQALFGAVWIGAWYGDKIEFQQDTTRFLNKVIINTFLSVGDSANIAKSTWTDSLYANHINLAGTQLITPAALNDSFGLFLRKNGSVALTANWAAGNFDITGLEKVECETLDVDYGVVNNWIDIGDSINVAKSTWTDSLYANHINLAGTQLITPGALNDSFALFLRKNGSVALTGNWAAGDFDITGLERLEADTVEATVFWHIVESGDRSIWANINTFVLQDTTAVASPYGEGPILRFMVKNEDC